MYKNVKSKIIMISVIVGLILIGTLGFLYITSISEIQNIYSQESDMSVAWTKVENIYQQAEISIAIVIIIFIVISIFIAAFLSRFVIYPKNKFIKGQA